MLEINMQNREADKDSKAAQAENAVKWAMLYALVPTLKTK